MYFTNEKEKKKTNQRNKQIQLFSFFFGCVKKKLRQQFQILFNIIFKHTPDKREKGES
jgi:hypothetical protein